LDAWILDASTPHEVGDAFWNVTDVCILDIQMDGEENLMSGEGWPPGGLGSIVTREKKKKKKKKKIS
jgi:hypothetical protein